MWQYVDTNLDKFIEACKVPDAFFKSDSKNSELAGDDREATMRQHSVDGRIVKAISGDPKSACLAQHANKFQQNDFLGKLDSALTPVLADKTAGEIAVQNAVVGLKEVGWLDSLAKAAGDTTKPACFEDFFREPENDANDVKQVKLSLKLAVKLGLLHLKRLRKPPEKPRCEAAGLPDVKTKTVRALWDVIVKRTDEILCINEKYKGTVRAAIATILARVNLTDDDETLSFGDLKDPVRIHEKAVDDYWDYFPGELPEANVVDVLRCRVKCQSSGQMTKLADFLTQASQGQGTELDVKVDDGFFGSKKVILKTIRFKNKFAKTDPTHFRNILVNCLLLIGDQRVFFELQSTPLPVSTRHHTHLSSRSCFASE